MIPEMLNPAPATVPALRVSAAVPEEVSVTDWVAGVFRFTLPKETLVVPKISPGIAAPRVMA